MTLLVLVICVWIFHCANVSSTEIQFDRIEILNDSYVEGYYNVSEFRITKFNRTTYVLNARADIFVDIDQDIKTELILHFNRLNNNQYTKLPMGLPKDYLCNIIQKYYRKFIMVQVKDCSNLPQPMPELPDDQICPIKKVNINIGFIFRNYDMSHI